jgi:hypothetical protein
LNWPIWHPVTNLLHISLLYKELGEGGGQVASHLTILLKTDLQISSVMIAKPISQNTFGHILEIKKTCY